jgi:hypothetical protein
VLGIEIALHANQVEVKPRDDGDTGGFAEVLPEGSSTDGK